MKQMFRNLLLLYFLVATCANFTSNCPQKCECNDLIDIKWVDCTNRNLQEIPKNLSTETQVLTLDMNHLVKIKNNVIKIIKLKELHLKNCELVTIEEKSFNGLPSLEYLDISYNSLETINTETFNEIKNVYGIILCHNKIILLENGLFKNLPRFIFIDLNSNRITAIAPKAFTNLPNLEILYLSTNKLQYLKVGTLNDLTSLSRLTLYDNPWRCDCNLQSMRDWVVNKTVIDIKLPYPKCFEPKNNHGKRWDQVDSNKFACMPRIIHVISTTMKQNKLPITLSCHAEGNPLPEISLILNDTIINGTEKYHGELKYNLSESNIENNENIENGKWVNLTIVDALPSEHVEYICVAKSPAGITNKRLTFSIVKETESTVLSVPVVAIIAMVIFVFITSAIVILIYYIKYVPQQEIRLNQQPSDYVNFYAPIQMVSFEVARELVTSNTQLGNRSLPSCKPSHFNEGSVNPRALTPTGDSFTPSRSANVNIYNYEYAYAENLKGNQEDHFYEEIR